MKAKSKINGYVVRSAAYALFLAAAFVAASSAFDWPNKSYKLAAAVGGYGSTTKSPSQPRALSFAERVTFQRAIEDVYWRHRIWPKENAIPKPALDAVMSQAQLENKVRGYLHDSLVLQDYWQRPITAQQLQAEMDRMARDTKQPEVLRELFEALGNDPAVIAECLARPVLAERLIADLSAQHETRHVTSPQSEPLRTVPVATMLGQVVYTLPKIAEADDPPCTDDTWTATTTFHAPFARSQHTAVWTGSEMIVWGADNVIGKPNTGGRYNPSTDSWTATTTINSPSLGGHTAIWTGSEMIVWGFPAEEGDNPGGRYNPAANTWRTTSTANGPTVRYQHTAIWTGSEMIVWGGQESWVVNTGGRYNPRTDSWTATSTTGAPAGRRAHTAVWTGNEMIVWGGYNGWYLNTGGRYNPITDTWTATITRNAPSRRSNHIAVWTGSEMIVWGRAGNTGGRYNPNTDSWTPTSTTNAPADRFYETAVWTGSEMIVWGGYNYTTDFSTGGRYNPTTDVWTATSTTNAPAARYSHTAVWTGSEMIVWGGTSITTGYFNTGDRYCAQPPVPLAITQPNGGELWVMGSVHDIKWDANLKQSDRLIISYSRTGGATWFRIAQDVPALSLSYSWQVDNYPTAQGRVKIVLQGNRSITDQSDANFTVQRVYITLLRPNGGEIFTIGQSYNIHWSRRNPGGNTVDIDYSTDNGTSWIRIATQAQDTGWYLWNVPGPATTTAKVRIRFHETPSVTDTTDAVFTING